jgi:hypothetical protein
MINANSSLVFIEKLTINKASEYLSVSEFF